MTNHKNYYIKKYGEKAYKEHMSKIAKMPRTRKLSAEAVRDILSSDLTDLELARKYGVHKRTIYRERMRWQ